MAKEDYEVGYRKPPKGSQFKPGKSGNPKGRPKGGRGFKQLFQSELNRQVKLTDDGKSRSMSLLEVIVRNLVAKAAKGDARQQAKVIDLLLQQSGDEDPAQSTAKKLSESDEAILEGFIKRNGGGNNDEEA